VLPAGGEREIPIWTFDNNVDQEVVIRVQENGAAVGNTNMCRALNVQDFVPITLLGRDQRINAPDIAFRGSTLGFGAGTVTVIALIYIEFANLEGVSSFGVPLPGW